MMPDALERVFVYGTLKKGGANHALLANQVLEGEGWIKGWDLYDLGPYPCVCKGRGRVQVEVYSINPSCLNRLDVLEGYPSLYDRQQVANEAGGVGWLYFMRSVPENATLVGDGIWQV